MSFAFTIQMSMRLRLFGMNLNIMFTGQNIAPSRRGKNMKILLATPEFIFK